MNEKFFGTYTGKGKSTTFPYRNFDDVVDWVKSRGAEKVTWVGENYIQSEDDAIIMWVMLQWPDIATGFLSPGVYINALDVSYYIKYDDYNDWDWIYPRSGQSVIDDESELKLKRKVRKNLKPKRR